MCLPVHIVEHFHIDITPTILVFHKHNSSFMFWFCFGMTITVRRHNYNIAELICLEFILATPIARVVFVMFSRLV